MCGSIGVDDDDSAEGPRDRVKRCVGAAAWTGQEALKWSLDAYRQRKRLGRLGWLALGIRSRKGHAQHKHAKPSSRPTINTSSMHTDTKQPH